MDPSKPLNNSGDIPFVYQKYESELKGYIGRRVEFKEDIEDIFQNIFYNLSKIDLNENPIDQISSWLYSVAQNQISDYYRKKKPDPFYEHEDIDDEGFLINLIDIIGDDSVSPEAQYVQSIVWMELELALGELPPEQRTVFELTELEGFSFKEIAESTGVPVNTLLSRKRYAVLYLREKLRSLYDDLITG